MFRQFATLLAIQTVFSLGALAPVSAQSKIEVVENAPIETDLMVPGIRQTADVWVEMIDRAKETIELEQFYVYGKEGQALDLVLYALKSAAKRGVKIRLLIDPKFYPTYPKNADELSKIPNIEVRTIDFSAHGGIQHAKYFVVDSKESFVGSCNFDWVALTHVHEVGLRIEDDSVAKKLQAIFDIDWSNGKLLHSSAERPRNISKEIEVPTDSPSKIEVVGSPSKLLPPGMSDTLARVLELIWRSSKSVRIQLYEYATKNFANDDHWYMLDDMLRRAASRGVQVQLLVDKTSLKDGKPDLEELAKLGVEVKIVTIPKWSGGEIPYSRLVHSKYMIVDHARLWLGSENWRGDYFLNSRNVGVILDEANAVKQVDAIFDRLWNSGYASSILPKSVVEKQHIDPRQEALFKVNPEVLDERKFLPSPNDLRPTVDQQIRKMLKVRSGLK